MEPTHRTIIDLGDPADRWRYVCPRGHTTWEPTNHHYWCANCANTWDVDPAFDHLQDRKTGASLPRDDVFLDGYDEGE